MPRDMGDVFQPKPGKNVTFVCKDQQSNRRISIKTMPRDLGDVFQSKPGISVTCVCKDQNSK